MFVREKIDSNTNSTQFNYNADHQRWKQVATESGATTTTYYVGGLLEKVILPNGVTEYRHAIPAGSGVALYTRRSNLSNSTYYITTDHLGSSDLILDSAGGVLARESFSAFGERRGENWQGPPSAPDKSIFSSVTRRGFTGHEMLDAVNLIHMNGRVYDPHIGRFLSPDPIIQTIGLGQALNPFSYVMNNPLTLIDPSGYSWFSKAWKSVGKFFGTVVGVVLRIVQTVVVVAAVAASCYGTNATGCGPAVAKGALLLSAIWGDSGGSKADTHSASTSRTVNGSWSAWSTVGETFDKSANPKGRHELFGNGKLILLDSKDPSFSNALFDRPSTSWLTVYSHGSEGTMSKMTPEQFARLLRMKGYWSKGQTIVLDACRVGAGTPSFASQLAKILRTTVIAPTGRILTAGPLSGNFEEYYELDDGTYFPKVGSMGVWNTYGPDGKLIGSLRFRGQFMPEPAQWSVPLLP